MEILLVSQDKPNAARGDKRGSARIALDLEEMKRATRSFEVANIKDKEHWERVARWLGLAVVVVTTATGTTFIAGLAANTNKYVIVTAGLISVLAAVLAAVNEKGPFADQVSIHSKAATAFGKLRRRAVDIDRDWARGVIDDEEANRQLGELEKAYDDLKETAPGVRDFATAHTWVDDEEARHAKTVTPPPYSG